MSHYKRIFHRHHQIEGTTLIELLVGMSITTIVTGLAMQALVRTQSSFKIDQAKVENGQKMSSVLEIVGREIKQAGELIVESDFPIIQVKSLNTGDKKGSSIIIYRALSEPVSVCQDYVTNTAILSFFFATDKKVPANNNNENKKYCTVEPGVAPTQAIQGSNILPGKQQNGWVNNRIITNNQKAFGILYSIPDRRIQSFVYNGESAPPYTADGSLNLEIKIDSFTPSQKISTGDTAYLVEKKEYVVCGTELKVRTNSIVESNDDAANPACVAPDNTTDPIATLETVATNISNMNITMITREVATVAAPTPGKEVNLPNVAFPIVDITTPGNNRGWQNIQSININILSIDPLNRNIALLSDDDKAKISSEGNFYPRNVLSSK